MIRHVSPRSLRRLLLPSTAAAVLALAACACPPAQVSAGGPPPPDTIRGLVVIVRTVDQPAVLIRPVGSAEVIPIDGPVVAALRDLEGFDVWVAGTRRVVHDAHSLASATEFRVISVEHEPVRDGRVLQRGDSLFITDSAGGATPIVSPPLVLRHDVDRRVWVAGAFDRPPTAFGVIHVTAEHDLRAPEECFDPRRPRRGGRPPD
ncbi:MAG TPA: hypothetical protein VNW46_12735 [Gemmatimonadaceae bacterium]|nr:hypothetical protein [Gemmatimonadaceae bacterium]